jgi:predicted acylesterase/phospholipase RssA
MPSIGLSGAGFLIFFLIGALSTLEERGVMQVGPNVPVEKLSRFAGTSAGAILTLSSCVGIGTDIILRESHKLADYCAAHNDCFLSLDAELRRTLDAALHELTRDGGAMSPDGVARAVERCRGRAFVNLSVFSPAKTAARGDSQGIMLSDLFDGRSRNITSDERRSNDNAVSEIGLAYRPGQVVCDLSAVAPGPKLKITQGLFPPGLGLHPEPWLVSDRRSAADAVDAVAASAFNVLLSGLAPTTSFRGRQWIADGVYTDPLPVPPAGGAAGDKVIKISAVPDGFSLAPGSPPITGADISPGRRVKAGLPHALTPSSWICHAAIVADYETRQAMYELGRQEAALFLDEE